MSRSFKKSPFSAITCCNSAKKDKQLAHRAERRRHVYELTQALKCDRTEDYVPPIRSECSHNNVYSWGRDGKQHYIVPSARDYGSHCLSKLPGYEYLRHRREIWPPPWYEEMMRK